MITEAFYNKDVRISNAMRLAALLLGAFAVQVLRQAFRVPGRLSVSSVPNMRESTPVSRQLNAYRMLIGTDP